MVYPIFFSFWNPLVFIVFDENHCKALFDDKMKSFKSSHFLDFHIFLIRVIIV